MPSYRHLETGQEVHSASQLTRYERSDAWETIAEGAGVAPGSSSAPAKSATRAEWDEYAATQGVDPTLFESKEALQEALAGGGDG